MLVLVNLIAISESLSDNWSDELDCKFMIRQIQTVLNDGYLKSLLQVCSLDTYLSGATDLVQILSVIGSILVLMIVYVIVVWMFRDKYKGMVVL